MSLNKAEQLWVESNMGLVGTVIKQEVKGINTLGSLSYDDLFQTGCIGLCNVAKKYVATPEMTSTLAYTYIRNEIFKLLRSSTLRRQKEFSKDTSRHDGVKLDAREVEAADELGLLPIMTQLSEGAPISVVKGIKAMILHTQGYTYREIGELMDGAKANLVTAWVSRARAYLQQDESIASLREAG